MRAICWPRYLTYHSKVVGLITTPIISPSCHYLETLQLCSKFDGCVWWIYEVQGTLQFEFEQTQTLNMLQCQCKSVSDHRGEWATTRTTTRATDSVICPLKNAEMSTLPQSLKMELICSTVMTWFNVCVWMSLISVIDSPQHFLWALSALCRNLL